MALASATVALVIGLVLGQAPMYGPQAAFFSELFGPHVRYSGASLGAQLGSVAATYALEHLGGSSHAYRWDEFTRRYERHFGALDV